MGSKSRQKAKSEVGAHFKKVKLVLTSHLENPYTPLRISEKKIEVKKKAELVSLNWFGNQAKKSKEKKTKMVLK